MGWDTPEHSWYLKGPSPPPPALARRGELTKSNAYLQYISISLCMLRNLCPRFLANNGHTLSNESLSYSLSAFECKLLLLGASCMTGGGTNIVNAMHYYAISISCSCVGTDYLSHSQLALCYDCLAQSQPTQSFFQETRFYTKFRVTIHWWLSQSTGCRRPLG